MGAAPGPPPETWDAYSTKSEENTGVISMIDLLIADLSKEMTEAETDEKNSQAALQDTSAHLADETKELMATEKYVASLHAECDWLLQYFDARKAARAGEVDSLKKAKAVLSGADYSLIQTRRHAFLRRAL